METIVKVDNLKCGGCAATIQNALLKIKDVQKVIVDPEADTVTVTHDPFLDLQLVKTELHHLGYPETGTTEGLDKVAGNIKSYVSCAIGKLSKTKDNKTTN
jgi:copper chaperone